MIIYTIDQSFMEEQKIVPIEGISSLQTNIEENEVQGIN